VIFGLDQSRLGGGVEGHSVFGLSDQRVNDVVSFDFSVISTREDGEIEGNVVTVAAGTSVNTGKFSDDLVEHLVFRVKTSSKVESLLEGKLDLRAVDGGKSVI